MGEKEKEAEAETDSVLTEINMYYLIAGQGLYTQETSEFAHPYAPSVAKPFHIVDEFSVDSESETKTDESVQEKEKEAEAETDSVLTEINMYYLIAGQGLYTQETSEFAHPYAPSVAK